MNRGGVRGAVRRASVDGPTVFIVGQRNQRPGSGQSHSGFPAFAWTALTALFVLCAVAPAWPSATLLPLAVLALYRIRRPNPLGLPVVLGAALALAGAASALFNGQVGVAVQLVVSLSVFVVVKVSAQSSSEELSAALISLFVAGAIASVLFIVLSEPVLRDVDIVVLAENDSVRLGFPVIWMASVNHVSYAIALGLASWVAWLRTRPKRRLGLWWVPVLCVPILGLWAIVLTGTRASLVAVALVALAALLDRLGGVIRAVGLTGLVLVLLASLTGILGTLAVASNVESLFSRTSGDLSGRLFIWDAARGAAQQSPLVGFGLGGDELSAQGAGAHNTFLALWLGMGILGVLGYAAWVLACVGVRRGDGHRSAVALVPVVLMIALLPIWAVGVFEWAAVAWGAMGIAAAASTLANSVHAQAESAGGERSGRLPRGRRVGSLE